MSDSTVKRCFQLLVFVAGIVACVLLLVFGIVPLEYYVVKPIKRAYVSWEGYWGVRKN